MDSISQVLSQNEHAGQTKKQQVYWVKNERMGGYVPSYDAPREARKASFDDVLSSYAPQPETSYDIEAAEESDFSFFDLLDMVNPLQHVPLVSSAYRAITGDEIKPISKVIGGGVFGGPAGIASGLVNAALEEETGKDALGNAVAVVGVGKRESKESAIIEEHEAYEDLPVALLSFAELPVDQLDVELELQTEPERLQPKHYDRFAEGRTAGTIRRYS